MNIISSKKTTVVENPGDGTRTHWFEIVVDLDGEQERTNVGIVEGAPDHQSDVVDYEGFPITSPLFRARIKHACITMGLEWCNESYATAGALRREKQ